MKPVCLLFFTLALSSTVSLKAESTTTTPPLITVTGTASTEVKPDQLLWSIEVKNIGPDLAKVADKQSSLANTVLSVLKQLGVEDQSVQTTDVALGPNRVYRRSETVDEGYFASTKIAFKLTDLKKYRDVWLRLANLGNVSVKSVTLDNSKRIAITKETRIKALRAAKEKAIAMAEALDAKIGEVQSIAEDQNLHPWAGAYNNITNGVSAAEPAGDIDTEGGVGVAVGTIPVKARVVVSFRLLTGAK